MKNLMIQLQGLKDARREKLISIQTQYYISQALINLFVEYLKKDTSTPA